MPKLIGHYCPECGYVIVNEHSVHWRRPKKADGRDEVFTVPHCNQHLVAAEPRFEAESVSQ